jgi:hypothetical protein
MGTTVLDDVASYLDDNTSAFTLNTNLFKGRFGANFPSTCICVQEILGFEPPAETYGSTVNIERPQIQVISRAGANAYKDARVNAETAYKVLREATTSINGVKYFLLDIRSTPYYLGEDDNSRHMVGFTVDVWKAPSS